MSELKERPPWGLWFPTIPQCSIRLLTGDYPHRWELSYFFDTQAHLYFIFFCVFIFTLSWFSKFLPSISLVAKTFSHHLPWKKTIFLCTLQQSPAHTHTNSVSSFQSYHSFLILPEVSFSSALLDLHPRALYLISIPAPPWSECLNAHPPPTICCPSFLLPPFSRSTPPSSLPFLFFLPLDHKIYLFQHSNHSGQTLKSFSYFIALQ